MANLFAIHSVGNSLVTFLRNSYPESLREDHGCTFRLLSSGELAEIGNIGTTLSLYLYRVTMNEHLRNLGQAGGVLDRNVPLAVDLHYLLTVWANSALAEHTILSWAMRQIHLHPVLNISSLSPEADWGPGDVVQLIPAELSNEDVMRIWDALEPSYRLSVSYIARVVRIDADAGPDARPVVAQRFSWTDREVAP
jgi:hypothetical protein